MTINGAGEGATTIDAGAGSFRTMSISAGQGATTATLSNLTLTGGRSTTETNGPGGNLFAQSAQVTLDHVRLTNGSAVAGGGIAQRGGAVTIQHSLIDNNSAVQQTTVHGTGGGVYMEQNFTGAGGLATTLTISDSTITANASVLSGGGIFVVGSPTQNVTNVSRSTIAGNSTSGPGTAGGGIGVGDAEPFNLTASIVANNTGMSAARIPAATTSNCSGKLTSQGANVASTTDCALTAAGDVQGVDAALGPLTPDGQTQVLPLSTASPAVDRAGACPGTDQRDVARPQGAACDSGAYELIPAPALPAPSPLPTPTATPTPTPTPAPPPAPVFHKQVVVQPVSGKVRVKLAGTNTFVDLASAADIPLGSTIDVKAGKLQLSSVPKANGQPQTATFFGGIFRVTQPGSTTDLKLNESLASCAKAHASAKAKKKPKTRHLWGSGSGAFRTTGQYSAATVRGTEWLVQDSCSGTLTRVKKGVVSVRDNVRHKTIVVRAGHRYLAKPKH
jgi:hypothetical protein